MPYLIVAISMKIASTAKKSMHITYPFTCNHKNPDDEAMNKIHDVSSYIYNIHVTGANNSQSKVFTKSVALLLFVRTNMHSLLIFLSNLFNAADGEMDPDGTAHVSGCAGISSHTSVICHCDFKLIIVIELRFILFIFTIITFCV